VRRVIHFLVLGLILCFLSGCASKQEETEHEYTWQEQYDLGMKYLLEENYEEAILAFSEAIKIDPKQAHAFVGRGDAYVGKLDMLSAEKDYLEALQLDKEFQEIYEKLADLYFKNGDNKKAKEILLKGYEETGDERLKKWADSLDVLPDIPEKYKTRSIIVSMYGEIGGFLGHDFYAFDEKGRMLANIWYNEDNGIEYSEEWVYDDAAGKTRSTVVDPNYEEEQWEDEEMEAEDLDIRAPGTVEIDGCEDQGWYWDSMGDDFEGEVTDEFFDEEGSWGFITDPTMPSENGRIAWEDGGYGVYEYDAQGRVSAIYTYQSTGKLIGHCVVNYYD